MSRIAIDIRPLTDRHMTGVGLTLLEALKELLPHASPTREYILFASGTAEALARIPDLPQNAHVRLVQKTLSDASIFFLSLMRKDALDILLGEPCDGWWFPRWTIVATKKPFALTVHDLSFFHTPHFFSFKENLLIALTQPREVAERAKQCIVFSEHTGEDLRTTWNIPPQKIYCAPPGVHETFTVREQPSDRSYRASYDLNRPYILSLANYEPRKNILGILEAYQRARGASPQIPILILAEDQHLRIPPHLLEHVQVLGYIPHKHRPALIRGAQVLFFPSFNEGFGLPVLEALACGTPVITSTATPPSSLFTHGIFAADPYNSADLAQALSVCLQIPKGTEQKERIHQQTQNFTWKKHAEMLERIFQRLC